MDFAHFLAGYLLILAIPGPNFLAVASLATLGGLRAALPLCLGLGVGSAVLAAVTISVSGAVKDLFEVASLNKAVCGALWIYVGLRLCGVIRGRSRKAPTDDSAVLAGRSAFYFSIGFGVAATNMVTGAYFAGAFFAMKSALTAWPICLLPIGAALLGPILNGLILASFFSAPAARRAVVAHERAVRRVLGAAFVTTGLSIVGSALAASATFAFLFQVAGVP